MKIDFTIGLENVKRYKEMGEVDKAKKLLAIIEKLNGNPKKRKKNEFK